jgi:Peptidase inhibitor I9
VPTLLPTLSKFPIPLSLSTVTIPSLSNTHTPKVRHFAPSFIHATDPITALNGYSAKLTGAALDAVLADPNVAYVVEDAIASINYKSARSPTTGPATPAPPLAVVDAFGRRTTTPTNGTDGAGVDIYGIGDARPSAGWLY